MENGQVIPYVDSCIHGRPQDFFQGGGQTFGGAPKKSVKGGPNIFLDKL